jgi:hypothetical protein
MPNGPSLPDFPVVREKHKRLKYLALPSQNATGNLLNNPTLFENNIDYFNELIRRIK